MSMSETTMTIDESLSIACQPSSPLATSRTANDVDRMRLKVVRTNFESSTIRTFFSGISVPCAMDGSAGEVDHDPAAHLGVHEALECRRQFLEGNGLHHLLQPRRPQVRREPAPDLG